MIKNDNCIFCKIAAGCIPCDKVYEDDKVLAFRDIAPMAKTHIVIIPKEHILSGLGDVTEENAGIIADVHLAAAKIARDMGIEKTGCRIVNNCGADAGQTVFHIHFHLLGGEALGGFGR